MKALDTNVLVRYLVADDVRQAREAAAIIEGAEKRGEPLFIPLLVMCETAWVLDRSYHQPRAVIAEALDQILDAAAFHVERPELLRRCIAQFRAARAALADYVIGAVAAEAGCSATLTLDPSVPRMTH